MTDQSTALAPIAPVQRALELAIEAGDINGMREVHALASALQKGARARGMGVIAENQAAEVVLRSERAIGTGLITLKDQGVLVRGGGKGGRQPGPEGPKPSTVKKREWAHRTGDRMPADSLISLAELHVSPQQSHDYQRLATMPQDTFERMLAAVKATGDRIAKTNFYSQRKRSDEREYQRQREVEAPQDSGFAAFRSGVHALVGWEVGEDGTGAPGANGLLGLPADDLAAVASLIRLIVTAYQEARAARG